MSAMDLPKEPKIMSSRLLTMKFMQRSTVKNSSPSSTGPSTPASNEPPSKRQRLSSGSYTPVPSSDYEAMQTALAAEEAKRAQAIERQAAEAGETRWVLSFKDSQAARGKVQMRIVQAGFAEIDGEGDEESSEDESAFGAATGLQGGRMKFGKGKAQAPKSSADHGSSDSEADSDPPDPDSDPNADPTDALIRSAQARADRQAKKQAARAESLKLAEKRRRKELNLNSKGKKKKAVKGSISNQFAETAGEWACRSCGQKGHRKNDCPSRPGGGDRWKAGGDLKILR